MKERMHFDEAKRLFERWVTEGHRGPMDFTRKQPSPLSHGPAFYVNEKTDYAFVCFYGGMHFPERNVP